jgi:tetratricopeptide (TPR) repeat protein
MRSLHDSSERLNEWLGNRRWRIFALCLPVVLATLLLAVVVGIVFSRGKSELQRRYDRTVKIALGTRQFEVARVASLRGLDGAKDERDRAQWIFYLALALNGQGRKQDAMALISAAAPLDPLGAGSFDAHMALAQSLLTSTNLTFEVVQSSKLNSTNAVAQILYQAERHLLSAVAIEPESEEANEMLARFYINTHQPAKARERLMKIYVAKPETALLLAVTSDLENDGPSTLQWAARALTTFENNLIKSAPQYNPADRRGLVQALMIEQKYTADTETTAKPRTIITNAVPQDSPPVWLGIVHMLLINGKYAAALETLEHQMHDHPDPAYPPAIGEICAALAQSIPPGPKGDAVARLRFIQEGLTNAPGNQSLQWLLVQAADDTSNSGLAAKMLLDERMKAATGDASAWWHFMLWAEGRLQGDMVKARRELQTAYQLAPLNPAIENDLAMDLSSGNQKAAERGLDIIRSVVKRYPDQALFRATRGQILVRLGRYSEAVPDLEFAAAGLADPTEDRQALAKADAALGVVPQMGDPDELVQVRTLMNNGDYASAVKILDHATQVSADPAYASAMADVCIAWLQNDPPSQPAERLRLIQKGLNSEPQNDQLRSQLLAATHATDGSSATAKKLLDQLVARASGDSVAEWHLLLGRDARVRGDLPMARRELQAAYKLAPQSTEIQIDLATVLATGNQEDLGHALELIQIVVDAFPDNAQFRNTRGRILARLGRNADAVDDLTFAVDRLSDASDSKETRLILAKVYDALGKSQLAEQQRRLAAMAP